MTLKTLRYKLFCFLFSDVIAELKKEIVQDTIDKITSELTPIVKKLPALKEKGKPKEVDLYYALVNYQIRSVSLSVVYVDDMGETFKEQIGGDSIIGFLTNLKKYEIEKQFIGITKLDWHVHYTLYGDDCKAVYFLGLSNYSMYELSAIEDARTHIVDFLKNYPELLF